MALSETTDLAVGAHPDDCELFAVDAIAACRRDPARSFTAVVCCDGRGDGDDDTVRRRAAEARAAAAVGGYGALVQLGLPSAVVRDPTDPTVLDALVDVLERTRPTTLYTHDPTDPHDTHVAVFCAVVAALRRCDPAARPRRLLACEVWRGLDWTTGDDRITADCSGDEELADALIRAHASQLDGTARFDLAAAGRRRAHAVFAAPGAGATAVSLALDCTPLVTDPTLDPVLFVTGAVERFRDTVAGRLRAARR